MAALDVIHVTVTGQIKDITDKKQNPPPKDIPKFMLEYTIVTLSWLQISSQKITELTVSKTAGLNFDS